MLEGEPTAPNCEILVEILVHDVQQPFTWLEPWYHSPDIRQDQWVCDCDCFWDVLEAMSRLCEWEHKEHWSILLWEGKVRCLDADDFNGPQESVKSDQKRRCDSQILCFAAQRRPWQAKN